MERIKHKFMSKRIYMTVTIALLLVGMIVSIAAADSIPPLQRNKDIVVRGGEYGLGNNFAIVYTAKPVSTYDVTIVDAETINYPEIQGRTDFQPAFVSKGHWKVNTSRTGVAYMMFKTTNLTTQKLYTFKVTDPSGTNPDAQINIQVVSEIEIPTMIPTTAASPTPTPTPTPDYAAMEAKIKAQETEIQNIKATLAQTTIPTPTPEITPMLQSLPAPTSTPVPPPTIDHAAITAALEKRLAEIETEQQKQGDFIYQIMKFLGLAE